MVKICPKLTTEDNINEVPLLICLASEKSNDENKNFHRVGQSNNMVFAGL